MAVVDRSPAQSLRPPQAGRIWPYVVDFEAGDTVRVAARLDASDGRVSLGWAVTAGEGATIQQDVRLVDGEAWSRIGEYTEDFRGYENAPFESLRFVQIGGMKSTLQIVSRFPLEID